MPPPTPTPTTPEHQTEPGLVWAWAEYGEEDPGEPSARSTPSHGRTPHPGPAIVHTPESTLEPPPLSPQDELLPIPEMSQDREVDVVVTAIEERAELDPPPQDYTLGQYVAIIVGGLLGLGAALWLIGAGLKKLWPGGRRESGELQQGVLAMQPVLAVPAPAASQVPGPQAAEMSRPQVQRRKPRRQLFPADRENQEAPSTEVEVLSSSSEEDTG